MIEHLRGDHRNLGLVVPGDLDGLILRGRIDDQDLVRPNRLEGQYRQELTQGRRTVAGGDDDRDCRGLPMLIIHGENILYLQPSAMTQSHQEIFADRPEHIG